MLQPHIVKYRNNPFIRKEHIPIIPPTKMGLCSVSRLFSLMPRDGAACVRCKTLRCLFDCDLLQGLIRFHGVEFRWLLSQRQSEIFVFFWLSGRVCCYKRCAVVSCSESVLCLYAHRGERRRFILFAILLCVQFMLAITRAAALFLCRPFMILYNKSNLCTLN